MAADFIVELETTLGGLGYQLVDWERSGRGLLRVFIDSPQGISVDDCALVSNHLTRWFAVENIDYERLEVSSPGLDRPLRKPEDFARFRGQRATLRLVRPILGQRRFVGVLREANATEVALEVDGQMQRFAFADIEKARLVPDI